MCECDLESIELRARDLAARCGAEEFDDLVKFIVLVVKEIFSCRIDIYESIVQAILDDGRNYYLEPEDAYYLAYWNSLTESTNAMVFTDEERTRIEGINYSKLREYMPEELFEELLKKDYPNFM